MTVTALTILASNESSVLDESGERQAGIEVVDQRAWHQDHMREIVATARERERDESTSMHHERERD
jgi:hypothetical protein